MTLSKRLLPILLLTALACALPGAPAAPQNIASPVVVTASAPAASATAPAPTLTAEPAPASLTAAFVKGGNIWLYQQERRAAFPLTDTGDVAGLSLSPDGLLIAYLRQSAAELWLAFADGSPPQPLLTAAELNAFDPSAYAVRIHQLDWLPGTRTLLFNTRQEFAEGPGLVLYDDLRAIHADTRALTVILPPGEGGNFAPSPDGRRIAFSTPGSLNLVNADGSSLRRDLVVLPQVVTYSEYQFYPHSFWHADSRSLAVIIPPSDPLGIPVRPALIWRVTAEGTAEMAGQVEDAVFFGGLLTLSADLGLVAYTRTAGAAEANRQELVVAGLDGSAPQVVAAGGAGSFQGVWSPVGRDLLFSGDFAPGLSLAQAGGPAVSVISDRQVAPGFRWAGAGRVVFWEQDGGIWRLVLAAAGGPPEVLAESDQPGAFDLFP